MNPLRKEFSMRKLYEDIEKYESNLNRFKDSRVRNTTQNYSTSKTGVKDENVHSNNRRRHLNRFDKLGISSGQQSKLELKSTVKPINSQHSYKPQGNRMSLDTEYLQQGLGQQIVDNHSTDNWLKDCTNFSRCKKSRATEMDRMKLLMEQINKRDSVYELVSKRLGDQNTASKLQQFFQNFQVMKAIVSEFQKMSKLEIDDEKQLLEFLQGEESDAL